MHVAPLGILVRHAKNLVVLALLVGHLEHADRLDGDHAAGKRRLGHQHQAVHRVSVAADRVDDEAVVSRVDNARPERAVEDEMAQIGVVLVLVAAALRDLDEGVELVAAGHG